MYNVSLISLAALGLVACSDSSQTTSTPAPADPAPTQGATAGNAPATDGVQGSTAPDAGIDPSTVVETPETVMDLGQAAAQKTQAEVKAGDHVTASGTVSGDCSGTVRVDVIEQGMGSFTPTGNGEGTPGTDGVKGPSGPAKPLTTFELSGTGDFSVAIPKGANVMVSALCDSNGDGRIDPSMDALSRPAELGTLNADKTGLNLQLELLTAGG
ncbi:MAG: hypothetical protein QGG40_17865, partial [Myxococcota bacterium]|nr:hypothetical protein [Myxococcota bacterium]